MYKKDLFKVISTIRVDVRCFSIDLNICPKLKSRLYQNQPNSKNKYFTYILRIAHTCWKLKIHKKTLPSNNKFRKDPTSAIPSILLSKPKQQIYWKVSVQFTVLAVLAAPSEINNIAIISPA